MSLASDPDMPLLPGATSATASFRRIASFPYLGELLERGTVTSNKLPESQKYSTVLEILSPGVAAMILHDAFKGHVTRQIALAASAASAGATACAFAVAQVGAVSASCEVVNTDLPKTQVSTRPQKRRVHFADECGKELTIVFRTAPTEQPPEVSAAMLRALSRLNLDDSEREKPVNRTSWHLDFDQPAADYITFFSRLSRNNVSLENAILRNDVSTLFGTLRVKNVCSEKTVFIRYTKDAWATYSDVVATYMPGSPTDVYHSFRFEIPLPSPTGGATIRLKLEFCICFCAGSRDHGELVLFWDNSGGKNYAVVNGYDFIEATI